MLNLNSKSQSKKVFVNKVKLPADPFIKRHKSQESYSDPKGFSDKGKLTVKKDELSCKKLSENTILIKRKETIHSDKKTEKFDNHHELKNAGKKLQLFGNRIIFTSKEDSVRQINMDESASENTKKTIKEDDDCDLCPIDETRSSQVLTDFYTNSIGEASVSLLEKGDGIINSIPKPFVKQCETNTLGDIESRNNVSNSAQRGIEQEEDKKKEKIDLYYRKLLAYAKKGDRDGFLDYLSKLYKIIGSKLNINFKDEGGWTALHYACEEGNLKIIEILIKMNVDVNAKTNNKKIPLHLAAEKGYFDVSRILIENGSTVSPLDDEKNSPIHICALRGHVELLKYLLERFPQADCKNIYGKTPLDLAKNDKVREVLREYLSKTTYQYHKITIFDTKDKFANHMLNNINIPSSQNGYTCHKNEVKRKSPKNMMIISHNKFQSKDYTTENYLKQSNGMNHTSSYPANKGLKLISNLPVTTKNKDIINDSSKPTITPNPTSTPTSTSAAKIIKAFNATNTKPQFNKINLIDYSSTSSNSANNKVIRKGINHDDIDCPTLEESENSDEENDEEESSIPTTSLDEEKVGPGDFVCHAMLGKGSFGEVYLVEKKNTKTFYAMKILSKDKIMAQNLVKYAMTERNVLSLTEHPFIVRLSYAFQSSDKLFLILDYCPGGDLAEHLSREKKFPEERAKIYLCEIILALEDLHRRDIIFRDLKPDNVVLDYQGHAMLTDFGLSKEGVLDNKGAKSFCGSIAYLAPEMLKRTGHGKSVDWYLLGVLFYEMLVGVPPFFTNNKDQLFRNIEFGDLQYPKYVSEHAVSLLKGLLNKDPLLRLGAGKLDAEEVKKHCYFQDIDWNDVFQRKLVPPTPVYKNKILERYCTPRVFNENDESAHSNPGELKHFQGWSFVKTQPNNND